ncbi:hypothetical protein ACIGQE_27790 [Streptomyces sp. NPDC053429]|uniref:hypothetical protein n=1 Tax=Streptomyces sp. NPDC053429 TaxID=3365702 RepID=UPI0037CE7F98
MEESREFYGLLGFEEVMNHGWIMTLASPSNPTAQISLMAGDKTAPVTRTAPSTAGDPPRGPVGCDPELEVAQGGADPLLEACPRRTSRFHERGCPRPDQKNAECH